MNAEDKTKISFYNTHPSLVPSVEETLNFETEVI
jgi:hypothetical protein